MWGLVMTTSSSSSSDGSLWVSMAPIRSTVGLKHTGETHRCPMSRLGFAAGANKGHRLGVEVVQQVVGVAVAVSAHHHQGNKGRQENGGQHPDGHDHHRLHGDSGSRGG